MLVNGWDTNNTMNTNDTLELIIYSCTFRFKVTMEIFVDDTKVLNVNQWICEQLLPLVKQEAENCLDLNKVIRGKYTIVKISTGWRYLKHSLVNDLKLRSC